MRRVFALIGAVIILITMSVPVVAGDVPEALGYEDNAQIFIGTLKDFELYNSDDSRIKNVSVLPSFKIKGDVRLNEIQTYELCYFGKVIMEKETEYLFGWLADNSVWVYALESYDENGIKLKITDDFAERIQDSLDSGLYEKLEKERLEEKEETAVKDVSKNAETGETDIKEDVEVKDAVNIWMFVGAGVLGIALIVLIVVKRKGK